MERAETAEVRVRRERSAVIFIVTIAEGDYRWLGRAAVALNFALVRCGGVGLLATGRLWISASGLLLKLLVRCLQ